MKNRSITYLLFLGICSMLFVMQSCQDTDDLQSELDSLKDRVKVLEAATEQLNLSIESLQKLMSGSVIVGVTPSANGYEIELSDGSTIKVYNSEKIDAIIPALSVDKDGFWQYTTDQGATYHLLLDKQNKPILAVPSNPEGTPIQSPKLRVDKDGYWEVSYNGGTSYSPLLDEEGDQMQATPGSGGNSVFEKITHNKTDRVLDIVLVGGEKLTFPIIDTFFLNVTNATGVQLFTPSESKTYEVSQSEVAEAVLQTPEGWKANLTENKLTITAPTANATVKEGVVNITIISDRNYLRIIPIQVKLTVVP